MAKTILVVEDDPRQMRLIQDLLKISGYITVAATDGEKGVELAKKYKPALIFMDIMMPKMDGYTACREIKLDKATKSIPVVMLTSLDFPLNKDLAKDVSSDGYITKPLDRHKLTDVMHKFSITS
ncbi:PleD family two-component system response regulator [Chloroflexota bacterium]